MSLNFWKVNLFANEIKMTKNNTILLYSHINKTTNLKSNGALENNNLSIVILTCSYIQINKAFEKLFLIRTQDLFMLIHEVEPAPLDLQRVLGRLMSQ